MPVLSSVALGGWIIDESLVKKTSPISEYTSLLAMVIGTSKFLFKTVLISLSGDPVGLRPSYFKKTFVPFPIKLLIDSLKISGVFPSLMEIIGVF